MNLDDFADLDFDRAKRCGFPEVIYAASKTPEQIAAIAQALLAEHGIAFATRVKDEAVPVLRAAFPDAC